MNRREMLVAMAGGITGSLLDGPARVLAEPATAKKRLGVCIYSYMIRPKVEQSRGQGDAFSNALNFLEHCHRLGAGGVQVGIGIQDAANIGKLRARAEACQMFIEGAAQLPHENADVPRFDAEVRTAKEAGARVIRAVIIPGRRYERFDTLEEFRKFAVLGERMLELAEPIAARHRVRLAIENHKDQRIAERIDLLKRLSSEYIGMCVDTGNSFALLDDPTEAVEAFTPWAYSVHLKDTAVQECAEGFLLADVALGQGFLDLKKMVQILRAAKPDLEFTLEAHTRDPLVVPCLTEKYWATFPDVPAAALARALKTVRTHASAKPLFRVSQLPIDEQIRYEEENVKQCLAYAHQHLGL